MVENRKHDRVAVTFRCWCETDDVTFYARVGDISEGGVFLRTSTPLEPGGHAQLRFPAGTSDLEIPVRVVWSRHVGEGSLPGMGLQFEDIGPHQRERLRRLIAFEKKSKKRAR